MPRQCRRHRYPAWPAPWQPRGTWRCPLFAFLDCKKACRHIRAVFLNLVDSSRGVCSKVRAAVQGVARADVLQGQPGRFLLAQVRSFRGMQAAARQHTTARRCSCVLTRASLRLGACYSNARGEKTAKGSARAQRATFPALHPCRPLLREAWATHMTTGEAAGVRCRAGQACGRGTAS